MTKFEYLSKLMDLLSDLDRAQIESSVQYYSEMIDDRIEDGLSEEEAVNAVGLPEEAAEKIRNDAIPSVESHVIEPEPVSNEKEKTKVNNSLGIVAIILIILGFPIWGSLLVSIASVIFSFYCTLWAVVVSLWAVVVSIFVCGIASALYSIIAFTTLSIGAGLTYIGVGLFLVGLGLFGFVGCKYLSKGAVYLSKLIPCSIVKLIKGRRSKNV